MYKKRRLVFLERLNRIRWALQRIINPNATLIKCDGSEHPIQIKLKYRITQAWKSDFYEAWKGYTYQDADDPNSLASACWVDKHPEEIVNHGLMGGTNDE